MKKNLLMAMTILITAVTISLSKADGIKSLTDTTKKNKAAKVFYTCPMHADVISTKPGKCPKTGCGMTLVKKAEKDKKAPKK